MPGGLTGIDLARLIRREMPEVRVLLTTGYVESDGVVADVGYLGGSTVYKIKLESGAVLRATVANIARLDRDTYSAGERVVAWFTPDDCLVLER